MKITASAIILLLAFLVFRLFAADAPPSLAKFEYTTIRWSGRDNTHLIRPNGQVEFIGHQLRGIPRPDRADERSFYMNVAMNGLTKEGYEFVAMDNDQIIMKKPLAP